MTCDDGRRLLEDMAYRHQLPRNDHKPPMDPAWAKLALPEVPVPPLRPRPEELNAMDPTPAALELQGVEGEEEEEAEEAAGALVVVAEGTEAGALVAGVEGTEEAAAHARALVLLAEGAETVMEEEDAGALVMVAEEAEAVGSPRRRQDFEVGGPLALMRYSESRGVEVESPPPPNIRAWRRDFERERRIKLVRADRLAQRLTRESSLVQVRVWAELSCSLQAPELQKRTPTKRFSMGLCGYHRATRAARRRWLMRSCALTLTDPLHGGGWGRRSARARCMRTRGGGRDCRAAGDHRIVRSVCSALVFIVTHNGHTWLICP